MPDPSLVLQIKERGWRRTLTAQAPSWESRDAGPAGLCLGGCTEPQKAWRAGLRLTGCVCVCTPTPLPSQRFAYKRLPQPCLSLGHLGLF